jgi:transcription-repair coupling factor (superfamily II helicase)
MSLSCLLPLLRQLPAYQQLVERLVTADTPGQTAILNAAKPFLIAGLYEELGFQVLAITPQPEDARSLHEQLQFWCPPSASLYRFTEPDLLSYRHLPTSPPPMLERTQTLGVLAIGGRSDRPPLIVSSALAAIGKTLPPAEFASACHTLTQGMAADPQDLLLKWQDLGYEREETVEVPGTMSKRGGIIDIFPASSHWPVRLEFVGKKVESICPP